MCAPWPPLWPRSWGIRCAAPSWPSRSSGALDRMYAAFPQGKQEYLDKYRADCLTPGNQVQLITPVSRREAKAVAIDDEFRLVVEYPDGSREALSAGEVSVRGMYGYV